MTALNVLNCDPNTGIHYGVISMYSILQAWADTAQPQYGDPTCPVCSAAMQPMTDEQHNDPRADVIDYEFYCGKCNEFHTNEDAYPEEPLAWTVESEGIVAENCLDTDVMIMKSPYFTYAHYCSPCVPNAGNLESPSDHGVRTYCFPSDWFEDNTAPYPVYSVETGELIPAIAETRAGNVSL